MQREIALTIPQADTIRPMFDYAPGSDYMVIAVYENGIMKWMRLAGKPAIMVAEVVREFKASRSRELSTMIPQYQSHKKVRAFKIGEIQYGVPAEGDGQYALVEAKGDPPFIVIVSHEYINKHKPQRGGYYVQYEDGYESWSPAEAFEQGYTKVQE